MSNSVDEICRSYKIDFYQSKLYTDPAKHADAAAEGISEIDPERVLGSDLLVHPRHHVSSAAGEELVTDTDALLPIILISHGQTPVGRMVTGTPAFKVEIKYTNYDNLRSQIEKALMQIRPVLEQRKMAFAKYKVNIGGNNIRLLTEELGLTREEVTNSAPSLLSLERLCHIEESIGSSL